MRILWVMVAGCTSGQAGDEGSTEDTGPVPVTDTGPQPCAEDFEIPYDGVDNDCDPETPDDDIDGDGVGLADDCDDRDPEVQEVRTFAGDQTAEDAPQLCFLDCPAVVEGSLDLIDSAYRDLAELGCLVSVGGSLRLVDNLQLSNVTALHGLASVGQNVVITGNTVLTDQAAQDLVDAIGDIGGTVTVGGNQ